MTQNQLNDNIVNMPENNNKEDRFSSQTLLNLFIKDKLNEKDKEKDNH